MEYLPLLSPGRRPLKERDSGPARVGNITTGCQNASTTTTDSAQPLTSNPLPVEQSEPDKKDERARKRPHSAGDLVENCSATELQKLVEKAVQRATIPLKAEIEALKAFSTKTLTNALASAELKELIMEATERATAPLKDEIEGLKTKHRKRPSDPSSKRQHWSPPHQYPRRDKAPQRPRTRKN
ncbi:hypothetical protein EX30DRAFT_378659 [Ascodesmis nigricans]|uniref:Uncharacterized protein n=1 Tax=Ascodesmis nigricans TaxID=341454 RepID=A0A4S2MW49_9PEZI|nr:hypothetical protein EX30DRAFT_378659 [Ascodesmis nigricans]